MSPRPSITENGTHYGKRQEDIMILISTTLSCKITAVKRPSGIPMLKFLAIPATLNTLVGTMITENKSPATAVNTLLVAVIASSISTETSRPLTYTLNGNDKFPNSHRFKTACGSGSLPSCQRLSTFLVYKSLVSCSSSIVGVIADAIHS